MHSFKNDGSAALVFPTDKRMRYLIVSSPPPRWLSERDLSGIEIAESGIYCLYFLLFSKSDGRAALSLNGRVIPGSETATDDGTISNTAVCSIRDSALPCSLNVSFNEACEGGVFLVIKCKV